MEMLLRKSETSMDIAGRASSGSYSVDSTPSFRIPRADNNVAWAFATIFILTRSCFRVAELAKGFGGKLANQQVPFMILEGAMIVLATATMTIYHPGNAFGDKWDDAGWSWKKESGKDVESAPGGSDPQLFDKHLQV
jgi:RTA1 like protein